MPINQRFFNINEIRFAYDYPSNENKMKGNDEYDESSTPYA